MSSEAIIKFSIGDKVIIRSTPDDNPYSGQTGWIIAPAYTEGIYFVKLDGYLDPLAFSWNMLEPLATERINWAAHGFKGYPYRGGYRFKTGCPLCRSKYKTLAIYPERQVWWCYRCGRGYLIKKVEVVR